MLAFALSQRHREVGVPLALGSTPQGLVRMVVPDTIRLACIGLLIGTPAGIAAARWTQALVRGVTAVDFWIVGVAASVTLATSMLAAYLPARRASRVAPSLALRAE